MGVSVLTRKPHTFILVILTDNKQAKYENRRQKNLKKSAVFGKTVEKISKITVENFKKKLFLPFTLAPSYVYTNIGL